MNKLLMALMAGLMASTTFAADVAQPETPGSDKAQAAAEAKHNAKPHGINKQAKQAVAEAPGSDKAQAKAEAKHLKKSHGKVNDSADKRLEKDHPNH